MRPIQLKIKGLHSFREMETIPLDRLCQGGVFGIFGPTGSGKSTILDAITLSLYGKVERASNNTQGIINQREKELFVSYTFELMKGEGVRRLRVERSYKVDGEKVRNVMSRLTELIPVERVLADKDREVTRQVESILGLTVDDFTRAVVLPQGKFHEFLNLKGKERREMLERLFHLEEYGERLNERLKARLDHAAFRLRSIEGEQKGLGDPSAERLEEARRAEKVAVERFTAARARRLEVERRVEEEEKRWAAQQELTKVRKAWDLHLKEKGAMEEKAHALKKAEEAERLYPLLLQVIQTEGELLRFQQEEAETKKALEVSATLFEAAKKNLETARAEKERLGPMLTLRLERLKEAQEIFDRMDEMKKEISAHSLREEELAKERDEREKERQKLLDLLERAILKQRQIMEESERLHVTAEERERMRAALKAFQELESFRRERNRLLDEEEKARSKMEETAKKMEEGERHLQTALEEGKSTLLQWQEEWKGLNLTYAEGAEMIRELERALDRGRAAMEEARRHLVASQLAESLHEGMPCPVCGSLSHPLPAEPHEDDPVSFWKGWITRLEEGKRTGERIRDKLRENLIRIEEVGKRLRTALGDEYGEIGAGWRESAITAYDPVERSSYLSVEEASAEADEFFRRIHQIQDRWSRTEQENDRDIGEWQRIVQRIEQARNGLANLQLLYEERVKALQELQEKGDGLKTVWDKKRTGYEAAFPDLPLERIEELEKSLAERERREEELKQKIDVSIRFIEEQEEKKKETEKRIDQLERELGELRLAMRMKGERIGEEEERLRRLWQQIGMAEGEMSPSLLEEYMKDAEEKRDHLDRKLREVEVGYEAAEKKDRTLKEKLAALSTSRQYAEEKWIRLKGEWDDALHASSFYDRLEVEANHVPSQVMEEWRRSLEIYRDREKELQREMNRLTELLQGKEIDEEMWQALLREKEEALKEDDEASKAQAKAERDREELERKAARWQELEKERLAWAREKELLQQLQSLLRGNAFVEFIAEEQLHQISNDASSRLLFLTRNRYALEVDSDGGFVVRDEMNGGERRPVHTLSGGETFLTSLALALSLSAQIQLKGEYPLQFFFLDEGFGTLDPGLLDLALTALERIHQKRLSIGIISHVPELKERIMKRLLVEPAEPNGRGTRVRIE